MIQVFGSVNLDLVVQVPHLPVEGETVLGPGYFTAAGGKGANQALAAARAGAGVALTACVGDDAFAELALAELRAGAVDLADLRVTDAPTGCAFIAVDARGRNQIVVASGANARLRADDAARRALARADLLLMQLEAPTGEVRAMLELASAAGVTVVLNAAPAAPLPAEVLRAVDWLLVNEGEACLLASALGLAGGDGREAAASLARHAGRGVVVTLGERGAWGVRAGERFEVPAWPVTAVDTVGAGDAFAGSFAAALDNGLDVGAALRRATVAGSLACTLRGAQPSLPTAAAVDAALAAGPAR